MSKFESVIKITIASDDKTTTVATASVRDSEEVTGTGVARVHGPDVMDHDTGDDLAAGRALKDLGSKLVKRGYKKVHALDRERASQREASLRGREIKEKATEKFNQEFAALIEELHPGTFKAMKQPSADWSFSNGIWKAPVGDGSIIIELYEDEAYDLYAAMQAKHNRDNLPA